MRYSSDSINWTIQVGPLRLIWVRSGGRLSLWFDNKRTRRVHKLFLVTLD